jgi:hypothetical protein
MSKKGVRVVVIGKPRPAIDVEAMTQIVIALGRELAVRSGSLATGPAKAEVASQ